jgi:hypothetical protein
MKELIKIKIILVEFFKKIIIIDWWLDHTLIIGLTWIFNSTIISRGKFIINQLNIFFNKNKFIYLIDLLYQSNFKNNVKYCIYVWICLDISQRSSKNKLKFHSN